MSRVPNPFYEICQPCNILSPGTVREMERTWDRAIEAALQAFKVKHTTQEQREYIEALRSTNQRGDPAVKKM